MNVSCTYQERLFVSKDVPGISTEYLLGIRVIRVYARNIESKRFRIKFGIENLSHKKAPEFIFRGLEMSSVLKIIPQGYFVSPACYVGNHKGSRPQDQ